MADSILLIGAGGFVGQRLLDAFAQRGDSVIAVSRNAFAHAASVGGRGPRRG